MGRRVLLAAAILLGAGAALAVLPDARSYAFLAVDLLRGGYAVRCGAAGGAPERMEVPFEGRSLAAWLHPHPRSRGRAVVVHGASKLAHRDPTARLFVRALYELRHDVLAIDLRGWGASPPPLEPHTPETFDFGRDVAAAVAWWDAQSPDAPPALLVGHSLGGGAVLRADAAGVRNAGVIAAGAPFHETLFGKQPQIRRERPRNLLRALGLPLSEERVTAMTRALLDIDPDRLEARSPRLLLYAEKGRNPEMAARYAAGHPQHRVLLVEGVGHALGTQHRLAGCDLYTARSIDQVREAIDEWLRHLFGPSAKSKATMPRAPEEGGQRERGRA